MKVLNAIVASDRTNGIGFTKAQQGYGNVSLPWKLAGEFKVCIRHTGGIQY